MGVMALETFWRSWCGGRYHVLGLKKDRTKEVSTHTLYGMVRCGPCGGCGGHRWVLWCAVPVEVVNGGTGSRGSGG